jgi:hypothetical protein
MIMNYTIVDATGEHFGYGRTADLAAVLADVDRLNADPTVMTAIASGSPEFYAAPFRAVRAADDRGRIVELENREDMIMTNAAYVNCDECGTAWDSEAQAWDCAHGDRMAAEDAAAENKITAHDRVVLDGDQPTGSVEYVERDVQIVNAYGDRWQVPAEHFVLVAPAVRGGTPATWTVSPDWTA